MLAFCGLMWWKKPEFPKETIDLGTGDPYPATCNTGDPTWATGVVSEGFTPVLARPQNSLTYDHGQRLSTRWGGDSGGGWCYLDIQMYICLLGYRS